MSCSPRGRLMMFAAEALSLRLRRSGLVRPSPEHLASGVRQVGGPEARLHRRARGAARCSVCPPRSHLREVVPTPGAAGAMLPAPSHLKLAGIGQGRQCPRPKRLATFSRAHARAREGLTPSAPARPP